MEHCSPIELTLVERLPVVKAKPQIKVAKADLKDLIRDELYSADIGKPVLDKHIILQKKDVAKIAKRIARRAIIGH